MRYKIVDTRKLKRNKNLAANTEMNQLTEDEIDDFMASTEARPFENLFRAMEALLTELALTHPVKVGKLRLGLIWLKSEASKRELPWGNIK